MQVLESSTVVVGGIECQWVPGTMDQIQVQLPTSLLQISLSQLQQVAGIDAVHEMYLKGTVHLPLSERMERFFSKVA